MLCFQQNAEGIYLIGITFITNKYHKLKQHYFKIEDTKLTTIFNEELLFLAHFRRNKMCH